MKQKKPESIRERMKCFCQYAVYSNGCKRIRQCPQCKEQSEYDRQAGAKEAIRKLQIKLKNI